MSAQIGPGIQGAYEGFFKGMDMVRSAKSKAADDQWTADKRSRDQAMWEERDAAERAQLQDTQADYQDKAQLRPQTQEFRTKKLSAGMQELDNTSTKLEIDGQKLAQEKRDLPQTLQDMDIAKAVQSAQTREQGLTALLQLGGKAFESGDMPGVTKTMSHLVNSKLIDAGGMGVPVSTQLVNIPKDEGALDFAGQPIAGQALKVMTDSGAELYVNPTVMRDAYRQSLAQQDAASAKMVKPGDKWVTPSGRVLAEGAPRVTGGIVVDPETGEVTDYRPRAAGGAGGGSGGSASGGKAPKSAVDLAMGAFETLSQKGETKLTSDDIAAGQVYVERAVSAGLTPNEAAFVAKEVAVNGREKVLQPYLDPNTLQITGAYRNPAIKSGSPIPMEPGYMSLEEYASTPEGKAAGQKALTLATEAYVSTTAAKTQEQRESVRSLLSKAANDSAMRDRLMAQLQGGDPAKLQHLERLLDAHRVLGIPAKPKTAPAAPIPSAAAQPAALGGIAAPAPAATTASMGGIAGQQPAQQDPQAAQLTTDTIANLPKDAVRKVFNDGALMRKLSQQQIQALQARWSKF